MSTSSIVIVSLISLAIILLVLGILLIRGAVKVPDKTKKPLTGISFVLSGIAAGLATLFFFRQKSKDNPSTKS